MIVVPLYIILYNIDAKRWTIRIYSEKYESTMWQYFDFILYINRTIIEWTKQLPTIILQIFRNNGCVVILSRKEWMFNGLTPKQQLNLMHKYKPNLNSMWCLLNFCQVLFFSNQPTTSTTVIKLVLPRLLVSCSIL